jgi:biofilm PGA synthesis N-glycosyltransferase PgaC
MRRVGRDVEGTLRRRGEMSRRYVLITPCRDEAEHLPTTIETVARQTVPPARWVIVDDGSTDGTPSILADAAARYDFLHVVTRTDRGGRSVGPGVIEAFYAGLEAVDLDDYEYLCKLDGDLDLPRDYFQRVIERFENDAYLGNFSGKSYVRENGRLVSERLGDENAVGAAKFYRAACFRDIGGFVRKVSWDGIDGHMCRLHGWVAQSDDDEKLRFIHLRRMGSSERSLWAGRKRWGRGKYFMGSTLTYVAAVSVYRMFERPYIIGAGRRVRSESIMRRSVPGSRRRRSDGRPSRTAGSRRGGRRHRTTDQRPDEIIRYYNGEGT